MRIKAFAILVLGFVLNSQAIDKQDGQGEPSSVVSLVQLLANPLQYDGKRVTVTGYLISRFEESALYLSIDSARLGDVSSSLWIAIPDEKLRGLTHIKEGFATITGTFNSRPNGRFGHLGGWNSAIDHITRIKPAHLELRLLEITDAVCMALAALSLIYVCVARSTYRALAVSFGVALVWIAGRSFSLLVYREDMSLDLVSAFGRPLIWVVLSCVLRFAKTIFLKIPVLARLDRTIRNLATGKPTHGTRSGCGLLP